MLKNLTPQSRQNIVIIERSNQKESKNYDNFEFKLASLLYQSIQNIFNVSPKLMPAAPVIDL